MIAIVHRDPRRSGEDLVLASESAHVWTIALDEAEPHDEALSADERARARRFRFDADRRRFVVAHVALRSILAGYLRVAPTTVVFTTGPRGKPSLDAAVHGAALRFNLSHSRERALVVVARDRDVGVDVEWMRVVPDLPGIVARFFSAAERATLDQLPADERLVAFFRFWTEKEACLKARGDGLDGGLDRPADRRRWEIFSLTPGAGYVGAVAIATVDRLHCS